MRNLVTLRQVSKLLPIEGADKIELAVIDGWSCIVKKGEFVEGSLGFYFEIDSFLPYEDERFHFLGKPTTYLRKQGYRIKTMKMRGVLSQGLLLPTHMFPELDVKTTKENYDKDLNVIKWDIDIAVPQPKASTGTNRVNGNFPSFIPKTDQPRLQNLMHYFDVYKDMEFEETLKLDGSSITMYKIVKDFPWYKKLWYFFTEGQITKEHFGVCSRNLEIFPEKLLSPKEFDNEGKLSVYDQSDFWFVAEKYDIERKLPAGFAIQGELIGPKIQNNQEKVISREFYCFNVYDIDEQKMLSPNDAYDFCKIFDIPYVPRTAASIKIFSEYPTLEKLQQRVTGCSMNPNTISEGRVYKALNAPITFKLISNEYLLQKNK